MHAAEQPRLLLPLNDGGGYGDGDGGGVGFVFFEDEIAREGRSEEGGERKGGGGDGLPVAAAMAALAHADGNQTIITHAVVPAELHVAAQAAAEVAGREGRHRRGQKGAALAPRDASGFRRELRRLEADFDGDGAAAAVNERAEKGVRMGGGRGGGGGCRCEMQKRLHA